MFENRVLSRIFKLDPEEATGKWSIQHNGELMNCTRHLFG